MRKKIYMLLLFFNWYFFSYSASNYCATPPFLNASVPPNILFVIDKSGSMSWAAYYKTWSPTNDISDIGEYDSSKTYEGYFIPNKVYKLKNGIWEETEETENCNLHHFTYYYGGKGIYKYYTFYWAEGICSGNKLNFARMTRVDLLRWAITGGRPKGCSGFTNENCDPDIICTSNTCILETHPMFKYNSWDWKKEYVKVPKSRIKGILQLFENEENRPRFGALFYDSTIYDGKIYIGDYPNGQNADPDHPYTYLKRAINYVDPGGSTGTAPAMWEAYDYFKQSNEHTFTYTYKDKNWKERTINFDGFSIGKGTYKDPNYFCDANGNNCKPAPCAKNFVILASDGQWNRGGKNINEDVSNCSIETGYENYSTDPVVPAYKMHHDILRSLSSSSGNTFDISVNGIYALGLFLGGTGEQSLKNIAVYGSFDTSIYDWPNGTNGSHWDGGTDSHYPWDGGNKTCYMDDCGYGKGSACTPLPPSSPDWDSDGDGNPDTFLSAQNAQQIKDSLVKFIRNILKRTASGTSLSVLSEKRKKGALITQAVFYPEKSFGANKKVTWLGTLYNYWSLNTRKAQNLREDSYSNYYLDVYSSDESKYDYILEFIIDNNGKLIIPAIRSNPDGTIKLDNSECFIYTNQTNCNSSNYCIWDTVQSKCVLNAQKTSNYCNSITNITNCDSDKYCKYSYINNKCIIDLTSVYDIIQTYNSLDDVHSLWEVGEKLKNRSANNRQIYGVTEDGSKMEEFITINDTDFDQALGTDINEFPSCLINGSNPDYDKLIRFIRGEEISGCRTRDTGSGIWKLGDIIYSTPQTFTYDDKGYSVTYVAGNDGMLHAFHAGYISNQGLATNQAAKICDSKNNCTTAQLGEELWAFIPRNVMPYLRYLADPDYCHIYMNDLQPYIIKTDYDNDGNTEVVLIGGLRLGGACGCTDSNCINPPSDTCSTSGDCIGLSSYYALDVTDPENPVFLWEFSHKDLGFTFSGPAYLRYKGNQYVMFLSGPTNYLGDAAQPLKIFVLKLNSSFKFDPNNDVYIITPSGFNNAFGGRLFTNGIDYNNDGNTDMVVFGITQKTGTVWQGNVGALKITDQNPNNWTFIKIFNSALGPVTAKVEYMRCFGMNYIYFGTGRWFYKEDTPGQDANDKEALYGVRIDGCLTGSTCNINAAHSVNDTCSELENGSDTVAWMLSESLEARTSKYNKERDITDPTPIPSENLILFTTMQPTGDICGFGGRTRVWALNCATGANAGESCPSGSYATNIPAGTIYLQASGANILQIKGLSGASDWVSYTPPESATQYVPPTGYGKGDLLLWLEK